MPVSNTDIKFYNAATATGGDILLTSEITDVLHALLPAVSAAESESGVVKYKKFYVKNTNVSTAALNIGLALSRVTPGDDNIELGVSTSNASTSATENFAAMRFYGVALTTAELNRTTRTVPIIAEDPTRVTEIFKVGDKVTFFDAATGTKSVTATIASVTPTSITIVEDVPVALVTNGTYISSLILDASLAANAYKGFWLKQTVKPYSAAFVNNTSRLTFYFDPV